MSRSWAHAKGFIQSYARSQGRIFCYYSMPLGIIIPYFTTSLLYYKIINYGLVILNVVGLWWAFNRLLGSVRFCFFLILLFFILLQNNLDHNLLVTDQGPHQIALTALLVSIVYLVSYINNENKTHLKISVALFFFIITIYEIYVPFIIVYFMVAAIYINQSNSRPGKPILLQALEMIKYHLMVLFAFFVIYFTFRYFFPSSYGRNTFGLSGFSVEHFFNVIYRFSLTSLPGSIFFNPVYGKFINHYSITSSGHTNNIFDITFTLHKAIGSLWLLKAMLGGYAMFFLLKESEKIFSKTKFAVSIILGFALLVLPNATYALSSYIQMEVTEGATIGRQYVYAGYFGVIIIVASLIMAIAQMLRNKDRLKKLFITLSIALIMTIGLLTDYTDYYVNRFFTIQNCKWDAVHDFVKFKGMRDVVDGSKIYAPYLNKPPFFAYYAVTALGNNYWGKYINMISGKKVRVYDDIKTLYKESMSEKSESYDVYFMQYMLDYDTLQRIVVFAKIASDSIHNNLRTNFISVYIFGNKKPFNLFFNTKEGTFKIKMMSKPIIAISGPSKRLKTKLIDNHEYRELRIERKGIILGSISVCKGITPD